MYKTLNAPHVLQIEISSLCPNRCQHCYNFWRKSGGTDSSASLSLDQATRIMDQIIANQVFHIVLTGGEPLLNKSVLFHMLDMASKGKVTTAVNSTLISLTEDDANRFKGLGVSVVLTSILGPTAEKHNEIAQQERAFERTIEGIRILQKVGVHVAVNMVVSKRNQHLIRETANMVKSLGLKGFNCTRAGCPGNCLDFSEFSLDLGEFRSYLEELHSFGVEENMKVDVLSAYPLCGIKEVNKYQGFTTRRCMAGVNTLAISASGEVRPCTHLDMSYGNLLTENLQDVWKKMSEWRDGSLIPETCKACKVLPWCGGGCRMEAKMRKGAISNPDPYASPADVDYVHTLIKSRKRVVTPTPSLVRLNPKIRWRKESFGAAVFVGTRFACYLNQEGFRLVQELPSNTDLSTTDLAKNLSSVQEGFMSGLIERKVLVKV